MKSKPPTVWQSLRMTWWVPGAGLVSSGAVLLILFTHNEDVKEILAHSFIKAHSPVSTTVSAYIDSTFYWVAAMLVAMLVGLTLGGVLLVRRNISVTEKTHDS